MPGSLAAALHCSNTADPHVETLVREAVQEVTKRRGRTLLLGSVSTKRNESGLHWSCDPRGARLVSSGPESLMTHRAEGERGEASELLVTERSRQARRPRALLEIGPTCPETDNRFAAVFVPLRAQLRWPKTFQAS